MTELEEFEKNCKEEMTKPRPYFIVTSEVGAKKLRELLEKVDRPGIKGKPFTITLSESWSNAATILNDRIKAREEHDKTEENRLLRVYPLTPDECYKK